MAVVWRHTELLLAGGNLSEAVKRTKAKRGSQEGKHLREELADVERRLNVNLAAAQMGSIGLDMLQKANASLMVERERLTGEIARLAPRKDAAVWQRLTRMEPEIMLERLRAHGTHDEQLGFLLSLYDRVEVFPDHVLFRYAGDMLEPEERPLPKLYSEVRGIVRLAF